MEITPISRIRLFLETGAHPESIEEIFIVSLDVFPLFRKLTQAGREIPDQGRRAQGVSTGIRHTT